MADKQSTDEGLRELALFAGAGGGILGGHLLGWRTVCAVEWEPYPASVLAARQNDGLLPAFPIWDNVRTFDGRPWRGIVDVVSGGFPCQDISVAGKGAGIDGERSGLWGEMARIIGEVRPRFAFVENSPALLTRGLGRVLGDLAALGYDCRWTVLGAADVGAPHQRDRIWIVAHTGGAGRNEGRLCDKGINGQPLEQGQPTEFIESSEASALMAHATRAGAGPHDSRIWTRPQRTDRRSPAGLADADSLRQLQPQGCQHNQRGRAGDGGEDVADTDSAQRQRNERAERIGAQYADIGSAGWWATEPNVGRVVDGVAARMDRLKAIGNGQVPQCAAMAWKILTEDAI